MEGEHSEWSRQKLSELIELYREREVLWNQTLAGFKNKNFKNYAWSEIANQLKTEKTDVQAKMKSIISMFQREIKKGKSGAGASQPISWWAFDSLLFLKDKNKPRDVTEVGIGRIEAPEETTGIEEPIILRKMVGPKAELMRIGQQTYPFHSLQAAQQLQPLAAASLYWNKRKLNPVMEEAFQTMKRLEKKSTERDEYHIFGEYVGHQIQKIRSERERAILKQKITSLLFEAELAQLDDGHQSSGASSRLPTPTPIRPYSAGPGSDQMSLMSESVLEHGGDMDNTNELPLSIGQTFFNM